MAQSAESVAEMVPQHTVWLDGPAASPTQIGARGYRFAPFEQHEAVSVEAHLFVLQVSGRAWVRRVIGGVEERVEVGPGDISLHPSRTATRFSWSAPVELLQVAIDAGYLRQLAHSLTGGPTILHMRHGLRLADDTLAQLGIDLMRELTPPHALGAQRAARSISERVAIHLLREHFDIERAGPRERSFTTSEWRRSKTGSMLTSARRSASRPSPACSISACITSRASLPAASHGHPTRSCGSAALRAPTRCSCRATELSAEIAVATGFADQSHFTRCFKQRFGEPPATMRRRLHNSPRG